MLVHICCSVDSHFFLQELRQKYPLKTIIGYFYNPNIHPKAEFELRYFDVLRSCEKLQIKLIKETYEDNVWFNEVKGFENECEGGKRCDICFDLRLAKTALKAKELGIFEITTTLLASPKKSFSKLAKSADMIKQKFEIDFLMEDFRKNQGTQRQFEMAKKDMIYRQSYCGCMFALMDQRKMQKKFIDELVSPINRQILPNSIEDRTNLYKKAYELEKNNVSFKILRSNFLNHRLLSGKICIQNKIVPSFFLPYSHSDKKRLVGKIEFFHEKIGYFNKENFIFLEIEKFNELNKSNFKNVKELYFSSEKINHQNIRNMLDETPFSLCPIVILDEFCHEKMEIFIDSIIYSDTKEYIKILNY